MAFRFIETQYVGENHSHSDGDWFEISPSGVLVVHSAKGRDTEFWAPHAWTKLMTDQPPGPLADDPQWGPLWS
jgi:hypothetical protein